jgi:hypothetical protein
MIMMVDELEGRVATLGSTNKDSQRHTTISFALEREVYEKLCQRLTGYGDRSLLFRELLRQFLNNEVVVRLPERQL